MTGLRIAACQTPEILGDVDAALTCVEDFARQAGDADLLLFPECFLQGYLVEAAHLNRYAVDLRSAEFAAVRRRLAGIEATLVIGLIERAGDCLYNTAVVLDRGDLSGRYRKTHLVAGESIFQPGADYPVFDRRGVRLGINICYDAQFAEAAAAVAAQGAEVLLLPAQNMMRRANAEIWRDRHNEIRKQRVRETGMWLFSADVTGERDGERIGYGPTCAISPDGDVVAQVPLLTEGHITVEVRSSR
ncbi:MAG: carbon-nitrogen hydrolase family protein [Hamadaea sp.]|uniref:carbon-nitrogen hydrolase family protein n=1 Tax=Hamadaea sp. TaxID=2024425 RepID=UPI0018497B5A|nr:carbon-nitrogen hydrolase family protein [Hamadaea sp.]NUT20961.1 carbon-nitrogen hydrolase family protein [Hamadaea sp.]